MGGGKLLGAVTEGDMNRFFQGMDRISLGDMFNTNIKYIVYDNDKQVYDDAEVIFNKSGKVNNIPVVDNLGSLLFQIDRVTENINLLRSVNNISEAAKNGSMEYLLKSGTAKSIIIIGADKNYLEKTKQIFYQYYSKLISETGINIKTAENIHEEIKLDDTRIISLNWFGFIYFNVIKNCNYDIITSFELLNFYKLKSLKKYEKKIIDNFMNIFSYKAIGFYYLNNTVYNFIEILEEYGIKIYDFKKIHIYDKYLNGKINSGMDIFLISGKSEEYIEKITIADLLLILEQLCFYKKLKGKELSYQDFMLGCVKYIAYLQNRGFKGFLQSVDSYWEYKLHSNIIKKCNIDIITKWEDLKLGERYIIDEKNSRKEDKGNLVIPVKRHFLSNVCEHLLFETIKKKSYVYVCSKVLSISGVKYGERNRYNYLENKNFFENGFETDIIGKDGTYLTEVIKDTSGCQKMRLNGFYYKFSSNYNSKYFNTDLYGNRIVTDTPKKYKGTIWIAGNCFFSGYAVEDRHTIPSFIQLFVNIAGYKYRVVNLSCDRVGAALYNKLLEKNTSQNDIVILQTKAFIQTKYLINIDYEELNNYFQNKIWFWDDFIHMGYDGYKFMAKKIFKAIEPVMKENEEFSYYNYKFYLEDDLECKIKEYIIKIKDILKENRVYNSFYNVENRNNIPNSRSPKTGAVVMNCNPFTYGHQYLIDTASRLVDVLYVFVVEEDRSVFPFKDRFDMVTEGTKEYNNVIVIPSGGFMISSVTFPGYFMKDTPTGESYDDFLDLKIFAHYIAPAFGIKMRFVGEEPYDKVTAQYNNDMEVILKETGIDVIEIPRKRFGSSFISATKARRLIEEKDYISLRNYLPETTMQKLNQSCILK